MSTGRLSRGRRRILLIALGGLAVIAVLLIAPLTKGGSQKPDARPQSTASDVLSHNAADPDAVDSPTAHDAAQSQVPDMSRREADDATEHAVYAHQDGERKDLPREQLVAIARDSGVPDIAAFEAGLDDPALHDAVVTDALEAQSIGVQSTPSFLIGGTPLMGAQPIEVFRQVIDLELTAAGE